MPLFDDIFFIVFNRFQSLLNNLSTYPMIVNHSHFRLNFYFGKFALIVDVYMDGIMVI